MDRPHLSLCTLLLSASVLFAYSKTDVPEGWASEAGGTTGGAGGAEVTVSNMADLSSHAKSSGRKIILVTKGTYEGTLSVSSDKTILGKEPGVLVKGGGIRISGTSNIIIRNIAVQGNKCSSYDECRSGADAVSISSGAHHVWLDHMNISDGQDGNCDITNGADYITITWSKFWYSYDKEHRFSNLIASADNVAADKGKLRITYAYNWWGERVVERQPRGRAGKVHVVNNLYTSAATNYACGPGVDIQMFIENNDFQIPATSTAILEWAGSPAPAWSSVGNTGSGKNLTSSKGTVAPPPYTLSRKVPASQVDAMVRPVAGNTMTLGETTPVLPRSPGRTLATPHLVGSPTGWVLANPSATVAHFDVFDMSGKSMLTDASVLPQESFTLPRSCASMVIRFKKTDDASSLFVPGVR